MEKTNKTITILHSNDIHGKFTGKRDENGKLCGSLAQLSGYISAVKEENPDTIYCNAGDMFQGSLIDSDFQGLSTMQILNLMDIDVMSLGNHELDYGISHMLFVSRYANFPIVNANFLVKSNRKHLFKPHHVVQLGDVNVLFIGLITENILDQAKTEGLVGTFVTVEDAEQEIRRARERAVDKKGFKPDITVLLTHIGYEADVELAKSLPEDLGVDIIVGGHSHTYLDEPTIENGIIILQVGMENTHVGRLDLDFNTETRSIDGWKWEVIPVDEDHCQVDPFVRAMVNTYAMDIDEKYGRIITRLKRTLDNYGRGNTTEVGQLFADAFADSLDVDVMFLASSSTRCYTLDMTVTLQDLREAYPYDGKIYRVKVTGEMLRNMVRHMLRDEVLDDWQDVFFHTSRELKIKYDKETKDLEIKYNGKPLEDDQIISLGLQEYYYQTSDIGLGYTNEELEQIDEIRVVSLDAFETLKNYFSDHSDLGGRADDRLIIRGPLRGKALELNKTQKNRTYIILRPLDIKDGMLQMKGHNVKEIK